MGQNNSMQKRIHLQFGLIAFFVILVTAVSAMLLFSTLLKSQVYDDLKTYGHVIANEMELMDGLDRLEESDYDPKEDGLRITLLDSSGKVILDTLADESSMDNHLSRPEIAEALKYGEGTSVRTSNTIAVHTLYYAFQLSDGRILRVGKDSDRIFHLFRNTVLLAIVLSLLILSVCLLLSHLLTKRLLAPIRRLAAHPDDIYSVKMNSSPNPGMRFSDDQNSNKADSCPEDPERIYSEIQPFVRTIREQHINILNHARMRQEFTANVSHELKTPLTAISGYAELIGSGMADEKDTRHFANEIYRSSDRLLTLINDIMRLSELDENEHTFEMEYVDLYAAAQGCLDMMELQAEKQDVALHLEGEHARIIANKTLIDELLYNLCSNGVRYNIRGGSVAVSVKPKDGKVLLVVKDTGIGIPREHQERVFERFYRVDQGRSKQNGGTGLGLAIVKHIVAQHNARIELESEPGKGTEIQIWF